MGLEVQREARIRRTLRSDPTAETNGRNDTKNDTTTTAAPASGSTTTTRVSQPTLQTATESLNRFRMESGGAMRAFQAHQQFDSTLRNEVRGDGNENCLEKAVDMAKPGDDVVLFKDRKDPVGHAVVRRADGSVVDPNAPDERYGSLDEYQRRNPRYTDPAVLSDEQAEQVLRTPPGAERNALIEKLGLGSIADRRVADSGLDTALDRVKAAQQRVSDAAGSGNFRQVDGADSELVSARNELKKAIEQSGVPLEKVNEWFARQSNDPTERLMVAEAAADLGRERADAVARQFGLGPNDEGRDNKPGNQETRAARTLEGQLRDQLTQVAHESVTALRGQGHSREQALEMLKKNAGSTAKKVLEDRPGVPNTLGMTDAEKANVYEQRFLQSASPEARAAYERGEKVVLALRNDSPVYENGGKGEFDDRFVVMWKGPNGQRNVREFEASLDPNIQYGNDLREPYDVSEKPENLGPYASYKGDSRWNPFDSDQIHGWGRISSGQTIRLQEGPHNKLYPPPNGSYKLDVDINGDGQFNDGAVKDLKNNNSYQLHGSAVGHTGSGGCITVPFHRWDEFRNLVTEGQPTVDGGERAFYMTFA